MSETSKFTEDILSSAKEKAVAVVSQAEADTNKAFAEAKLQISREAQDIIRNAQNEADNIKRRHISESRHRLKLREQVEKNKILTEVLENTKKRLFEVTRDQATYNPLLSSLIVNGIHAIGLDTVVVHLNSADSKSSEKSRIEREIAKVEGGVKLEWSKEPIEAVGGAIVSSTDGKTRIVCTLDEKFEAVEPKLLVEAGKVLFEE